MWAPSQIPAALEKAQLSLSNNDTAYHSKMLLINTFPNELDEACS